MALSILKNRYSPSKTATSTSNSDDNNNNKSRRKFRPASSTSVEFINEVEQYLPAFMT